MPASTSWRQLQQRRVSRRRLLKAGAAGAAGLVAAAALGVRTSAPAGAITPARGGQLRTPVTYIDTLDPHLSPVGDIAPKIYNTLVTFSNENPEVGYFDLTQALERPDDSTYVFSMRPGVTIAPNTFGLLIRDMDSTDVFASYQRIWDEPKTFAHLFVQDHWQQHEVPSTQTYVIHTTGPYAYFLHHLSTPFTAIPPRNLIQRGTLATQGAGGGPFTPGPGPFSQGQPSLSLHRNPHYGSGPPGPPYLDSWLLAQLNDRAARRAAFISGTMHSYTAENRFDAEELLGTIDCYEMEQPVNTFISLTMNVKRPPWNDPRIRKAAMHAMNRQEYIDLVYHGDARANGLVHWPKGPFALPEEELEELQPYNPGLARQLIKEATGEQSVDVTIMFPVSNIEDHDRHLPVFLEQMQAAGFIVQQDALDFTAWLDRYTTIDYDASLALNQIYDTPEVPLDFQHSLGPSRNGLFAHGLQDAAIDSAIDAARQIEDPASLIEAVHDAQRQIYAAGPAYLPIVSPYERVLYRSFVRDVPLSMKGAEAFRSAGIFLAPEAIGPLGDTTCDMLVNSVDASVILQQSAGRTATLKCAGNADVNLSGTVNSIDAALILQHNAGLLPGLPP